MEQSGPPHACWKLANADRRFRRRPIVSTLAATSPCETSVFVPEAERDGSISRDRGFNIPIACRNDRRRAVLSPAMDGVDRVQERCAAAALARHYRDQEGLPLAEIVRGLGRAEATVKAYLYDPSYANKGLYTSLGATRAVYGAPAHKADPGHRTGRRHGVAAPARRPIPSGAARQGWWMGRERSVCEAGLNTGVHATPFEEE